MTQPDLPSSSLLTPQLMRCIFQQYRLRVDGFHGLDHWARVRENGLRLAARTGADMQVVELFAVFHDACRWDEGGDLGHGPRGGRLAESMRRKGLFTLDDARFDLLVHACRDHTRGETQADPTVQTCWDADRLDLLRVWVTPDPKKLCTETAREPEFMDWCNERARTRDQPQIIKREWIPLL
jgi:uncharacterized protein